MATFPRMILVIDDHDDGRESLGLLLQALGFVPFLAKNSGEGLEYLRKGLRPCVILLDLIMAGDGWQFRVEQMANPEWASIPVIVGTGLTRRPEYIAPEVDIPPETMPSEAARSARPDAAPRAGLRHIGRNTASLAPPLAWRPQSCHARPTHGAR
jgi:CheY-like chemotaxis protein